MRFLIWALAESKKKKIMWTCNKLTVCPMDKDWIELIIDPNLESVEYMRSKESCDLDQSPWNFPVDVFATVISIDCKMLSCTLNPTLELITFEYKNQREKIATHFEPAAGLFFPPSFTQNVSDVDCTICISIMRS